MKQYKHTTKFDEELSDELKIEQQKEKQRDYFKSELLNSYKKAMKTFNEICKKRKKF